MGDIITSQANHEEPPPLAGEEDDVEDVGYDTDVSDDSIHVL